MLSLECCPDNRYPSVGRMHAPAIRLERALHDLFGLDPSGCPTRGPGWTTDAGQRSDPAYQFLPVEGENLHQIPVGPVHAGIIEPGHFRFTCDGETVVRLEQRLGYVHKGIDALLAGAAVAARIAPRRPYLGRFHGGLRLRLLPRGGGRAGHRPRRRAAPRCAA